MALVNLSQVYYHLGDVCLGKECANEALKRNEAIYGPRHPGEGTQKKKKKKNCHYDIVICYCACMQVRERVMVTVSVRASRMTLNLCRGIQSTLMTPDMSSWQLRVAFT